MIKRFDRSALLAELFRPVNILPLVYFRVVFGGIMVWEVWRYFHYDRVYRYYIEPTFTLPYAGFEWVQPLPGDGMIWLFYGLGVLAGCLVVGLLYRVSAVLFFLGFTYVFLLDQAQYLNHFYLISLLSFILIFLPAHRAWSLDALLQPGLRARTAPLWTLGWLRFQIAVPYVFGGIAKLNADWLQGEPMRLWLAARTDFPVIGSWFTSEAAVYAFSYGGLLFDLLVIPLLLWRRTRWIALVLAAGFHLMNAALFNIGIFPWLMLAAMPVFLPAAWLRWPFAPSRPAEIPVRWRPSAVIVGLLAVYSAVQIMVPLRHFTYPTEVSWSEDGHTFAWHMKLRAKDGDARFFAHDPQTGALWEVDAAAHLTPRQHHQMSTDPDMLHSFARHLSQTLTPPDADPVAIHVWAMVSLNGRPPQLMIDPSVDLARQPHRFGPNAWVLPLAQPLGAPAQPTLLMLRRAPYLALINVGTTPIATADLMVSAGHTIREAALAPGDCAIWSAANTSLPIIPCNALQMTVVDVLPNPARLAAQCAHAVCVVNTPPAANPLARQNAERERVGIGGGAQHALIYHPGDAFDLEPALPERIPGGH
ncbi:MAG: HTTM domain-containing protein [Chloroflexi bacterium]|nr:HTTM domain-containing protein [Chloroflexota bacterium]